MTDENNIKHLANDEVTNHTATLWKYIPVPENEPEPFPEYLNYHLSVPDYEVIASRVRGKKHKHEGSNCDDWFSVKPCEKMLCIAVSDGAGSKKFSRIGAKVSCETFVSSMEKYLKEFTSETPEIFDNIKLPVTDSIFLETCGKLANIVRKAIKDAFDAVENAFQVRSQNLEYSSLLERELKLTDFSATLLTALVIPISEKSNECVVITCQIGDGMTALINGNDVKLMGIPDSGDFSGETDFLTSPKMHETETLQIRTKISKSSVDHIFMMTDGVADDYFPNETEMLRLYFDLVINKIIPDKYFYENTDDKSVKQNITFLKRLPDPLEYPTVNDKSKTVSLQYTNRICNSLNISLKDICNNRRIISLATFQAYDMKKVECPADKLKIWLDNYVERGSFDDRTLVIVNLRKSL